MAPSLTDRFEGWPQRDGRHMFLSLAPTFLCMASVAESSSSYQPLISMMAANAANTVLSGNASVGDN